MDSSSINTLNEGIAYFVAVLFAWKIGRILNPVTTDEIKVHVSDQMAEIAPQPFRRLSASDDDYYNKARMLKTSASTLSLIAPVVSQMHTLERNGPVVLGIAGGLI